MAKPRRAGALAAEFAGDLAKRVQGVLHGKELYCYFTPPRPERENGFERQRISLTQPHNLPMRRLVGRWTMQVEYLCGALVAEHAGYVVTSSINLAVEIDGGDPSSFTRYEYEGPDFGAGRGHHVHVLQEGSLKTHVHWLVPSYGPQEKWDVGEVVDFFRGPLQEDLADHGWNTLAGGVDP